MKVCHLITRLIVGGAQENTVLSCLGLAQRGYDVVLAAGPETGPEGSLWSRLQGSGVETVMVDSLRRAVHPWRDAACLLELTRLFRRLDCSIVHTHSSKAGIIGRMAARRAKVPLIVHTIHGMSFNRTQPWPRRCLYRGLERRVGRYTDALVSVADAMTDQAVTARLAQRERFVTIRSGMLVEQFGPNLRLRAEVRAGWGFADDQVVVGTVARLFRNKGYEQIIAAMGQMVAQLGDRLRFVWVGDGRDRVRYERWLKRLGLRDRVHLAGLVAPEQIPRLIGGFDVLLHASQWEGLAKALPQALLMEVPVVSFDNDGAPEVVIPGVTGELVPFNDLPGLADAVVRLARDPQLRRQMGQEGRRRYLTQFDQQRMVEQLDQLYQKLANKVSLFS